MSSQFSMGVSSQCSMGVCVIMVLNRCVCHHGAQWVNGCHRGAQWVSVLCHGSAQWVYMSMCECVSSQWSKGEYVCHRSAQWVNMCVIAVPNG